MGRYKRRADALGSGAEAQDRVPEARCSRCGELVRIETDRQGRLIAWDMGWTGVHRHPEAALGEGPEEADDSSLWALTEDDVIEILEADESTYSLAKRYDITQIQVRMIWRGQVHEIEDYDYTEGARRRRERATGRRSGRKEDG